MKAETPAIFPLDILRVGKMHAKCLKNVQSADLTKCLTKMVILPAQQTKLNRRAEDTTCTKKMC
jgi:hypothetical protein